MSPLTWQRASVPGHIHSDLLECGIIANPYEQLHELGCQWVDEEDWYYRTYFEFTPDPRLPRRVLRFEGLDTVCRIYLNQRLINTSDNMFVELEIDVTHDLVAGNNELRVEFQSAARIGRERRAEYFQAEGLSFDTVRFEPRAFVRKSQYMFGWDWGPSLASVGIWRPVTLIEYASRLKDVSATQRHQPDGSVEIEFHTEQDGPGHAYHFVEGFDKPLRDGETLRVTQPRLWWPRDMGQPELYAVTTVLADAAVRSDDDTWIVLDQRQWRIGLREILLQRKSDAYGETFQFIVNGRELYALGANWIPDDSFPSRVDAERQRQRVQCAYDLGMNMLRVWGGGVYESDAFYDICDELGLLVWQDFPYACSYYPDGNSACDAAKREAMLAVRRLRNHPSLAIWCGNNENQTMRDCGWDDAAKHPPRYYGERIYVTVLPDVLRELDPSRPYIPTTPTGKGLANSGGDGDQHYWDVWHGRGDWKYYLDSTARFCSEFGFACAPGHNVWRAMDPATEMLSAPVHHPTARWHDKTGKGYDTFVGLVELHYPKCESIEDWVYYSQLNQRDALRFGIEHFRRSEFCRGALVWQLNDCWPGQTWSVIDSAFRFKAAAYELRRLYSPLLSSVLRVGQELCWWAILDNAQLPQTARFVLDVRRLATGDLLDRREASVELQPGERRVLSSLDISRYEPTEVIICTEVEGRTGYSLICEPKQLKLDPPEVVVRPSHSGLALEVSRPVVDLYLYDEGGDCEFFDNFLTLPSAGSCVARCRGVPNRLIARSLAGFSVIRHR